MKYLQFEYILKDLENINKKFLFEGKIHFLNDGFSLISSERLTTKEQKEIKNLLIRNDLNGDVDEFTIRINE